MEQMAQKLDEFVQRMKSAAPNNLKAVVLYGSAATGEFHEGHSNVNLLCLVENGDPARLELFHSTVEWWTGKGHPAPPIFSRLSCWICRRITKCYSVVNFWREFPSRFDITNCNSNANSARIGCGCG